MKADDSEQYYIYFLFSLVDVCHFWKISCVVGVTSAALGAECRIPRKSKVFFWMTFLLWGVAKCPDRGGTPIPTNEIPGEQTDLCYTDVPLFRLNSQNRKFRQIITPKRVGRRVGQGMVKLVLIEHTKKIEGAFLCYIVNFPKKTVKYYDLTL